MAVQLHCGEACFLSGTTAGALFGLRSMPERRIQVTIRGRVRVSLPSWVETSVTSWIAPDCVERTGGRTPMYRPVRHVAGAGRQFNDQRFQRAAEDAWHRHLITPGQAAQFLERYRGSGRAGVGRFERWLDKTGAQELLNTHRSAGPDRIAVGESVAGRHVASIRAARCPSGAAEPAARPPSLGARVRRALGGGVPEEQAAGAGAGRHQAVPQATASPGGVLGRVRRIVDGDDEFRARLASAAVPELVDEIGIAWLGREAGWEDHVAALVERRAKEAAERELEAPVGPANSAVASPPRRPPSVPGPTSWR